MFFKVSACERLGRWRYALMLMEEMDNHQVPTAGIFDGSWPERWMRKYRKYPKFQGFPNWIIPWKYRNHAQELGRVVGTPRQYTFLFFCCIRFFFWVFFLFLCVRYQRLLGGMTNLGSSTVISLCQQLALWLDLWGMRFWSLIDLFHAAKFKKSLAWHPPHST